MFFQTPICYLRQLDLPDGRQYLEKLRDRFSSNQERYATIVQWAREWLTLGDDTQWSDSTLSRLKSQALQVVVWLDGDFNRIRELNAILPSGISIFCPVAHSGRTTDDRREKSQLREELVLGWRHIQLGIMNQPLPDSHRTPDQTEDESKRLDSPGVRFMVLSTRKWADILPTVPHYATGYYHSAFATDDLRSAISEDDKWLAAERSGNRNGWLECLMDLLANEIYDNTLDKEGQDMAFRRLVSLAKGFLDMPPHLFVQNVVIGRTQTKVNRENEHPVMEVWKGRMKRRAVCLKVIRSDSKLVRDFRQEETWEPERGQIRDILRETLAWHRLCHPNIAEFLGINRDPDLLDRWTIVIPWMENRDILTYLKKSTLPSKELDKFKEKAVWEVVQGLAYLHAQEPPIYHGDLQASHVLVTDDLRCCLFNFGRSTVSGKNQAQSISGKSGECTRWQAPEVLFHGLVNCRDKRAIDVYAFGCVVSEIYTGKLPWGDEFPSNLIELLRKGRRPELPSNIPDRLKVLTKRCWSQESSNRPLLQEIKIPEKFLSENTGPRFTVSPKSYDIDFPEWLDGELSKLSANPEGCQAIEAAGKIVLPTISYEPSPTYQASSNLYSKIKKPRRAARLQLIYERESQKSTL